MGHRIDVAAIPPVIGSAYPAPHDLPCRARERRRLGDAAGLTQFGVNLLRLPPGAWSSQRHWQTLSDEFVYVLSGEVTLVTDAGEEVLRPGDAAGFKAGDPDGHCLRNHTDAEALVLEVGTRLPGDGATYSDIDMLAQPEGGPARFTTEGWAAARLSAARQVMRARRRRGSPDGRTRTSCQASARRSGGAIRARFGGGQPSGPGPARVCICRLQQDRRRETRDRSISQRATRAESEGSDLARIMREG